MKQCPGFTLLEVIIALALLSSVAILVIHATGDGLAKMGDSGWRDRAAMLARMQAYRLERSGTVSNQQGSFAPDWPNMKWKATFNEIEDKKGRRLELIVSEEPGKHEFLLERILAP